LGIAISENLMKCKYCFGVKQAQSFFDKKSKKLEEQTVVSK